MPDTPVNNNNTDSSLLLQSIIDVLPIRIFWKSNDLKYLGCNKAFALDAGFNLPEEMIGKDDYQMGWKDQAEIYRADDKKVIETGVSKLDYEEPQTTPDGNKIWLITNKIPLKDMQGKIIGVIGTYLDITGRKKTEEDLKNKMIQLEEMNKTMVDRELKMVELKKKIEELENNKANN